MNSFKNSVHRHKFCIWAIENEIEGSSGRLKSSDTGHYALLEIRNMVFV